MIAGLTETYANPLLFSTIKVHLEQAQRLVLHHHKVGSGILFFKIIIINDVVLFIVLSLLLLITARACSEKSLALFACISFTFLIILNLPILLPCNSSLLFLIIIVIYLIFNTYWSLFEPPHSTNAPIHIEPEECAFAVAGIPFFNCCFFFYFFIIIYCY